jgi:hypothetical protein
MTLPICSRNLLPQIIHGLKFREFTKKAFGIDFLGPPPPLNENIVDWKRTFDRIYESVEYIKTKNVL